MSSRPLLIAGIVGGALAAVALFVLALGLVAIDGATMDGRTQTALVLGVAFGWLLDGAWISLAVDRLAKLRHGTDGEDDKGGEGWGRSGPNGPDSRPPSEGPDWWPEFESDLRDHLEERDRAPVAG